MNLPLPPDSLDDETLTALSPAQIRRILQERDEARQALDDARSVESMHRLLLQNLHAGVVVHAPDSRILFANQQAHRLLGLSQGQMQGKEATDPHWRFMRSDGSPMSVEDFPVMRVVRTGAPIRDLVGGIQHHKDGEVTWVLVNAFPEFETTGQIRQVVVTFIDISDRVRAEAALRESEERFRVLADDLPAMVCEFLPDSALTYVNQAYANYFDTSAEALIGQPFLDFIPVAERQAVQNAYLALTPDQPMQIYTHRVLQNGRIRWQEWRNRAIFSLEGKVLRYHSIGFDITDRKIAEVERADFLARTQAHAQQIAEIIEALPGGILLLDGGGRVLMANPRGRQKLAILAGASEGDQISHLGGLPLRSLLTTAASNESWTEIRADRFIFEVTARPLSTPLGMDDPIASRWVMLISDVTQARGAQEEMAHQQRLAAVGQLAAGIAHDFNNILAVIGLHLSMLNRAAALPGPDQRRLTTLQEQIGHATQLIQQILDFSRRAVLERQSLELGDFLAGQVSLLERALPEHVAIQFDRPPGQYTVMADATRMQQVIMNLAVNARDAMPRGGELRISLAWQQTAPNRDLADGPWVQITVADSGSGIPPEALPHIFEPFFTTKSRHRGAGLGLAQVHGIVKQHGGEIVLESTPGTGTRFIIYLPGLPDAPDSVSVPPKEAMAGAGQTILVVEDNRALLEALRDTLEDLGYQVLCAEHGLAALEVLQAQPGVVDLVLSDLVMPRMGGDDLLVALAERGISVPMLILSGHPLEGELESLSQKGLAGWLTKPIDVRQLAQLLAQTLDP